MQRSTRTAPRIFRFAKPPNNTQYTVGRYFLQETYLKVDFERNNFSIYQAVFSVDPFKEMHLVDISRPHNSTFSGPRTPEVRKLNAGEVAGIAIAASAASLGLVCFLASKNSEIIRMMVM